MNTVTLKLKIFAFVVLAILGFSLVGITLEQVKQIRAAEAEEPALIREQFAASLGDPNAQPGADNAVLSSLKYVCPFH